MNTLSKMHKFFAQLIWNKLSAQFQKTICRLWVIPFQLSLSRFFIPLFCKRYKLTSTKLEKFIPLSREKSYLSFQDFFARRLASPLKVDSHAIWPCQGHVCEHGQVANLNHVTVKGQKKTVHGIFNKRQDEIPNDYFFVNIFLHNHHYHHLHMPKNARITHIEHISGQLNFLRPWLYSPSQISEPSLVNERVVIECEDSSLRKFYVCLVGGMGVGTIKLLEKVSIGAQLEVGDELGYFLLGSTCCLLLPWAISGLEYLKSVNAGQALE